MRLLVFLQVVFSCGGIATAGTDIWWLRILLYHFHSDNKCSTQSIQKSITYDVLKRAPMKWSTKKCDEINEISSESSESVNMPQQLQQPQQPQHIAYAPSTSMQSPISQPTDRINFFHPWTQPTYGHNFWPPALQWIFSPENLDSSRLSRYFFWTISLIQFTF